MVSMNTSYLAAVAPREMGVLIPLQHEEELHLIQGDAEARSRTRLCP